MIRPPLKPMLAKAAGALPEAADLLFEPKWDGFRCIVFRDGDQLMLGSRNDKPLTRYFPELLDPLRGALPDQCVVDGEIVIATPSGLDFDALGQRIHPAESRIERLSIETPAAFVAFDLIGLGANDLRPMPFGDRRRLLERIVTRRPPTVFVTPATRDRDVAADWFERFEGAGFDGVVAKPAADPYQPGVRAVWKVKHQRTADVVVAGFRPHKHGNGVGSLLLGLYDAGGLLHSIGVASSFSAAARADLLAELGPLAVDPAQHPWARWSSAEAHDGSQRMPGAPSRWSSGDGGFVALDCSRVAEISYQGLTEGRLRHPAKFLRWRPDKSAAECGYEQLDQVPPAELAEIFGLDR